MDVLGTWRNGPVWTQGDFELDAPTAHGKLVGVMRREAWK